MIEGELVQYGVFGLWTIFNIWLIMTNKQDFKIINSKLISIIENNTAAMTKVSELLENKKRR